MGLGNLFLLCQCTTHVVSLILALFMLSVTAAHTAHFGGHCALGSEAIFTKPGHPTRVLWSGGEACTYSQLVAVLTSLFCMWYDIKKGTRFNRDDWVWHLSCNLSSLTLAHRKVIHMGIMLFFQVDSSFRSALLDTACTTLLSLMMTADAISISVGFASWCQSLTGHLGFSSCRTASFEHDIFQEFGVSLSENFYFFLGALQFATWANVVALLVSTALAWLKQINYGRQEQFFVSLRREKARLLRGRRISSESPGYEQVESS